MKRSDYNGVLSCCQTAFILLTTVDVRAALTELEQSGASGQHDEDLLRAALPLADFGYQLLRTLPAPPPTGPEAEPGHG